MFEIYAKLGAQVHYAYVRLHYIESTGDFSLFIFVFPAFKVHFCLLVSTCLVLPGPCHLPWRTIAVVVDRNRRLPWALQRVPVEVTLVEESFYTLTLVMFWFKWCFKLCLYGSKCYFFLFLVCLLWFWDDLFLFNP